MKIRGLVIFVTLLSAALGCKPRIESEVAGTEDGAAADFAALATQARGMALNISTKISGNGSEAQIAPKTGHQVAAAEVERNSGFALDGANDVQLASAAAREFKQLNEGIVKNIMDDLRVPSPDERLSYEHAAANLFRTEVTRMESIRVEAEQLGSNLQQIRKMDQARRKDSEYGVVSKLEKLGQELWYVEERASFMANVNAYFHRSTTSAITASDKQMLNNLNARSCVRPVIYSLAKNANTNQSDKLMALTEGLLARSQLECFPQLDYTYTFLGYTMQSGWKLKPEVETEFRNWLATTYPIPVESISQKVSELACDDYKAGVAIVEQFCRTRMAQFSCRAHCGFRGGSAVVVP